MSSKRYKFSRYGMYLKIENFLKKIDLKSGRCLVIGDSINKSKIIYGRKTMKNTALIDMLPLDCEIINPPYPYINIQSLPYSNNSLDYILADQVLEHVKKPWLGIKEAHRVLRPNGLAIFTTCLMQSIHGVPKDYWRFTLDGLRVLFEDFEILHTGQNGNFEFIKLCETGYRGQRVEPGSNLEEKAICNDGKCPLTIWIIARK